MALQRRYSQRNGGLETYDFQPEDTKKCTLRIIFESLGTQFGDETSQLELQVWQWRHIKADTGVLSELDGKLKLNNAERITTTDADQIKSVCTGNVYRSPSLRSFGVRTIQKIFQDAASCLCLIQRPVQENRRNDLHKKLRDSSIFVSGKATCFVTRCGIAVVTSKSNEKMVTETTHKLLTGGSHSSSSSSSASSVDDSSMEDTFTKLQHRRSVQLEGNIVPFFRDNAQARNHLILKSKLQGITCAFTSEENKLLLLAGTKEHLDMFNDTYLKCIKQITWDFKDSNIFKVLTKTEVVAECNEYCRLRFPGKAMFVTDDANHCISIVATDDALPQAESHLKEQMSKYENGAIKLDDRSFKQVVQHWEKIKQIGARLTSGKINISQNTDKQAITVIGTRDAIQDFNTQLDEYLSSPELCFLQLRFQGKKQKLLQSRPKAKEYVEQNVAKCEHVDFDTQANEFVLVASGEHRETARELLSLVKTRDIRVRRNSVVGKSLFDLKQELLNRMLPCHEKMLVEVDIPTGTFSITATKDVFDEAVRQFEDVYKDSTGRVRRESYEAPLSPMSPSVTPVPFQVVTQRNWKDLTINKYIQNLLQSCPEARTYVSNKMLSDGVQVRIAADGTMQYMEATGTDDQRVENILKNCIEKKDIDFEILPVGGYLKPSEARATMKRLLQNLSIKLLIEADDSQKVLTITSTKDIAADVITGVKRFLQDYTYSEETILLTKEETRTFWMKNAELRDIEKSLSEEKVKVSLNGSQLMITGAKVGVDKCKKKVTDMRYSQNNTSDTTQKDASHSFFLSNQMAKVLQDMPHWRHFVNRVFAHTACSARVSEDGSRLTRTQRNTTGGTAPSNGPFKKNVKAPLPSRITTMDPRQVKNTMAKKEPVLADKVLIYEDESALKLLIVGDAADVEQCYRIIQTM